MINRIHTFGGGLCNRFACVCAGKWAYNCGVRAGGGGGGGGGLNKRGSLCHLTGPG